MVQVFLFLFQYGMGKKSKKILYVSDLDGTLLDATSRVSPFTVAALNRVITAGALFSVATARTPATVVALLEGVQMQLPAVLMTGALVYDLARRRYLARTTFAGDTVPQVLERILAAGLLPMVYYLDSSMLHVAYREPVSALQRRFMDERNSSPYKRFIAVDDYGSVPHDAILIFCMGDYEAMAVVHRAVEPLPGHRSYLYHDAYDSRMGYLEVYPEATTKAAAIRRLADEVCADEIVVFGDNRNDIPMFELATRSYAVANAVPELKACATGVIDANTDDGVARFLLHECDLQG